MCIITLLPAFRPRISSTRFQCFVNSTVTIFSLDGIVARDVTVDIVVLVLTKNKMLYWLATYITKTLVETYNKKIKNHIIDRKIQNSDTNIGIKIADADQGVNNLDINIE